MKFHASMCECKIHTEKVLFFKPATFMNNSGYAVRDVVKFYKMEPKDLIVFHDDLDLQFSQIKITKNVLQAET